MSTVELVGATRAASFHSRDIGTPSEPAALAFGRSGIGDGTGSTGLVNGTNDNQVGTAAAPINPQLGPLADNGGPTRTVAPLPGSPAIDRGGPDPVLTGLGLSTDQRGRARVTSLGFVATPADGDGRDVGAVEAQPTTLTVNTTSDAASPPAGTLTGR